MNIQSYLFIKLGDSVEPIGGDSLHAVRIIDIIDNDCNIGPLDLFVGEGLILRSSLRMMHSLQDVSRR